MTRLKDSLHLDVSQLTPAGWCLALGSSAAAVAAMFACMTLIPTDGGLRAKAGGWLMIAVLAASWVGCLLLGALFLRLAGLSISKQAQRRTQGLQSFSDKSARR